MTGWHESNINKGPQQNDPRNVSRSSQQTPRPLRRMPGGVRLSARDGDVVGGAQPHAQPLARAFLAFIEKQFDAEVMKEGLEFAQRGQVAHLHFDRARVTATVQGRAPRRLQLEIRFPAWSDQIWQQVINMLTAEAIHSAEVLSGRVSAALLQTLDAKQLSLVPRSDEPLQIVHQESDRPAEHGPEAAAISYLLTERLGQEPLLMFELRGMPISQLLMRLRERQTMRSRGQVAAHEQVDFSAIDSTLLPLEALTEEYFGTSGQLAELEDLPTVQHQPHALLRRLGPSPLKGRFPMVGLLESIYDTVAESARHTRDRAEHLEDGENNDSRS